MREITPKLFVSNGHEASQRGEEFDKVVSLAVPTDHTTDKFLLRDDKNHSYQTFKDAVDRVIDLLRSDNKTLVHCQAGISRSVSVSLAVCVTELDMEYGEAFSEIKSQIGYPHPALERSAKRYIEEHTDKNIEPITRENQYL